MKWYRKNHIVSGFYDGVVYAGRVTDSFKMPDGQVQHRIALFEPIRVNEQILDEITVDELFTSISERNATMDLE